MSGAERLRLYGFLVVLVVAALRALVVIEPAVWFADVDPALEAMPLLAMAQRGSLQLDLLLLGGAFAALLGEHRLVVGRRSGRASAAVERGGAVGASGVHPWMLVLALLPVPVVLFHAIGPWAGNAFRGSTWCAAMVGFVAVAHVVRDPRMRAIALAVLLGVIAMLAVRGAVQVLVEHPAMVELYRETRAAFLAERGWPDDSSAALTYERRLMQAEATGWFALSNSYSTMMASGLVALAALAWSGRRLQQSGNTALLAMAAAVCAALLAVNGGKGAIGAGLLGLVVAAWIDRSGRSPKGLVVFAAAALALAAVVARGVADAIWGERIGELSLLFRSFYLEGGIRILADGLHAVLGIGPDRVQDAFASAKPAMCPEDVKSLHSVFADWFVALGVSATAWFAVLLIAYRARIAMVPEPCAMPQGTGAGDADRAFVRRIAFGTALAIGVASILLQLVVEAPTVDLFWFLFRTVGLAAGVVVATIAAQACADVGARPVAVAALGSAVVVLVHAQLDMVLWAPGPCALALALLAAGSTLGPADASGTRLRAVVTVLAASALVATGFLVFQAAVRDGRLARAAALLTPIAESRAAGAARAPEFRAREIAAREQAAIILAADDWATSAFALAAAARQYGQLARLDPAREDRFLDEAWSIVQRRDLRDGMAGLRADIAMLRLREGRLDAAQCRLALSAIEEAVARAPHNPRRRLDLALALEAASARPDLAVEADDLRGSAASAYRATIAIDDRLRLDPLSQLSARERAQVAASLERLRARGAG
jgi:hypothetical protein